MEGRGFLPTQFVESHQVRSVGRVGRTSRTGHFKRSRPRQILSQVRGHAPDRISPGLLSPIPGIPSGCHTRLVFPGFTGLLGVSCGFGRLAFGLDVFLGALLGGFGQLEVGLGGLLLLGRQGGIHVLSLRGIGRAPLNLGGQVLFGRSLLGFGRLGRSFLHLRWLGRRGLDWGNLRRRGGWRRLLNRRLGRSGLLRPPFGRLGKGIAASDGGAVGQPQVVGDDLQDGARSVLNRPRRQDGCEEQQTDRSGVNAHGSQQVLGVRGDHRRLGSWVPIR